MNAHALLRTQEVAKLLRVHPKHVYRLLKKGLPARRVGSEWRFDEREVLAWSRRSTALEPVVSDVRSAFSLPAVVPSVPPLIASNGDRVVLALLELLRESGTVVGLVQSDKEAGFRLLTAGEVLAAGSHAGGFPTHAGAERIARLHLVTREVGLLCRGRPPRVRDLEKGRIASRPASAGVRQYLDQALEAEGLEASAVGGRSRIYASHLEVACAVARGEADVGLASRAWAEELGLGFHLLAREAYGLLIRARDLGVGTVVRVCEMAQSERFRNLVAALPGYDPAGAGDIKYDGV